MCLLIDPALLGGIDTIASLRSRARGDERTPNGAGLLWAHSFGASGGAVVAST